MSIAGGAFALSMGKRRFLRTLVSGNISVHAPAGVSCAVCRPLPRPRPPFPPTQLQDVHLVQRSLLLGHAPRVHCCGRGGADVLGAGQAQTHRCRPTGPRQRCLGAIAELCLRSMMPAGVRRGDPPPLLLNSHCPSHHRLAVEVEQGKKQLEREVQDTAGRMARMSSMAMSTLSAQASSREPSFGGKGMCAAVVHATLRRGGAHDARAAALTDAGPHWSIPPHPLSNQTWVPSFLAAQMSWRPPPHSVRRCPLTPSP